MTVTAADRPPGSAWHMAQARVAAYRAYVGAAHLIAGCCAPDVDEIDAAASDAIEHLRSFRSALAAELAALDAARTMHPSQIIGDHHG